MSDNSPITVLVADDTDSDRLILESIVRKQGHRVVSASDGLQAVEQTPLTHARANVPQLP